MSKPRAVGRRAAIGTLGVAALWGALGSRAARPLHAEPAVTPPAGHPTYEVKDLTVAGDAALGRRFTLLCPRHLAPGTRVPLLVLLHGLGETHDEAVGAHAWLTRYGLGSAYERLLRAPVSPQGTRGDWGPDRLSEVNRSLAGRPFEGLCVACPFTPNVGKLAMGRAAALEGYAAWLDEVVVPTARREAPALADAAHTYLDGCSLGGYVGLEAFLRRPASFGAWGGVQSAYGAHRVPGYADRLEAALRAAGPRRLHILTSTADPFRAANVALASALRARSIAVDLRVSPGPHDQPWLRETGTIEMLLWHERAGRVSPTP